MKKWNVILAFMLLGLFTLTSCGDDETNPTTTEGEFVISQNITSDTTWSSGNVYELASRIVVESGATLTIEPGTVIKGRSGQLENSTALIIARGAKINAVGTPSEPIIFTSASDRIQAGEIVSPNLTDESGLWGGLVILGNAPISADASSVQIEGIPPSDQNGLYGGSVSNDNSGVLSYVSIRHGGTDIGEGNEINGLTLGGVGSGTSISNIEIMANQDDGLECFGGTVNISNVLVWFQGDDAFDMDQDYTGTLDNFAFIGGSTSDHALELDGPEGAQDNGGFTLRNGTLMGYNDNGGNGGEYIDFRAGVSCVIENCYFKNFSDSSDVELDNNGVAQKWIDGNIEVRNIQFDVSHLSSGLTTIDQIWVEKTDSDAGESSLDAFTQRPVPASVQISTIESFGADISVFENWTLGDALNYLDNL